MGVHPRSFPELAPAHDDFAHARLPIVRRESRRASFNERVFPQHCCGAAFYFTRTNYRRSDLAAGRVRPIGGPDWRYLDERLRRGRFRNSSLAGRIGGVDCGAERCAQRNVLYADADCLCCLHAEGIARPLPNDVDTLCVWPDVKTDVDHDAGDSAAARLLAAESISTIECYTTHPRKNSTVCFVDRLGGCDADRTARRNRSDRTLAADLASSKRSISLPHLYLADGLARESRDDLSAPRAIAVLGNSERERTARTGYCRSFHSPKAAALSHYWLAMVFDHAVTGDWFDSGGQPGTC